MTRRQALLFRSFAVWTVFVWVIFVKNIAKDHAPGHGAGFKAIHYTLAVISVIFAIAAWRVVTALAGKRAVLPPRDKVDAAHR